VCRFFFIAESPLQGFHLNGFSHKQWHNFRGEGHVCQFRHSALCLFCSMWWWIYCRIHRGIIDTRYDTRHLVLTGKPTPFVALASVTNITRLRRSEVTPWRILTRSAGRENRRKPVSHPLASRRFPRRMDCGQRRSWGEAVLRRKVERPVTLSRRSSLEAPPCCLRRSFARYPSTAGY
jgi:hypothetical protein